MPGEHAQWGDQVCSNWHLLNTMCAAHLCFPEGWGPGPHMLKDIHSHRPQRMHLTWITPGPVICVGDWWEEADSQTHLFRGCVQSIHSWKGKSDSEMTSLNIIHHQVWLKCKMQCWAELWECYCAPQGGRGLSPAVFTSGVQLCIHTTTSVCFGTASGFMALDHVGPLEKSRSILLWLETCMVHSHTIKDDIMFVIALNPSGRGHIDFIQQPTHAISSTFMFTTHTISQMRLPTTPPFFVHMVGFEPRFHQWMTHILPIYLWVEWRCYAYLCASMWSTMLHIHIHVFSCSDEKRFEFAASPLPLICGMWAHDTFQ